jgi:hypothetical protein
MDRIPGRLIGHLSSVMRSLRRRSVRVALRRVLLAALIGAALLGLAGCGSAGGGRKSIPSTILPAFHSARAWSFISLWPACACGRTTDLDQFSLSDGRRLHTLAHIKVRQGQSLPTPAVDRAGRVWLTFSSGPACTSNVAGCGPKPNTCSGHVERLDLHTGASTTVLSPPHSEQVTDALPSPNSRQAVLVEGGCTTGYFNEHFVVTDLASGRPGRQWPIGADAAPCHDLTAPGWSANGRELVFAYGPSVLSRHAHPAPGTCEAPRFNRLVMVSSQRGSTTPSWRLLKAKGGCSYEVATFDRWGVTAVESCVRGSQSSLSVNTGHAFLIQLNHRDRVIRRLALQPGWENGAISTEPGGAVLVSQSQPANAGYPERDWVWQFNGRALRLVAHYRADDAAQVIAVPTAAP